MRSLCYVLLTLVWASAASAEERPLIDSFLTRGDFANAELECEALLRETPDDDQLRLSLGIARFLSGVESLGQSLYQYGVKQDNNWRPFVRFPVPKNPDPAPINYLAFRKILDDFYDDLKEVEQTLADIKQDEIQLPLRLATIKLDLDANGEASDKLVDIMEKINGRKFTLLEENPDFLVMLDRGDVAWMRAYCHLMMAMLDGILAVDSREAFSLETGRLFANPVPQFEGDENERRKRREKLSRILRWQEPRRVGCFRRHFISVAELNQETWKFIRAETDDDHEWLPNPQQTGVLGMPVREEMIVAWLEMMEEFKALLKGERAFLKGLGLSKNGRGLDLKAWLDDPPAEVKFDWENIKQMDDKYFTDAPDVDLAVIFRAFSMMSNGTNFAYPAWFN